MFSPAIITPGARQAAFDFGVASVNMSDAEWAQALPLAVAAPDMVAACIGRREALDRA